MTTIKTKLLDEKPSKDKIILPASDFPNYYWEVKYVKDMTASWEVYVAVNQSEIELNLFEKNDLLFVAIEQGIFVLNTSDGSTICSITDTSYVQSIEETSAGIVLTPSEDELLAFSQNGNLLWRTTFPDVIEDIEEQDSQIEILDISSETYRVDIFTGKPV